MQKVTERRLCDTKTTFPSRPGLRTCATHSKRRYVDLRHGAADARPEKGVKDPATAQLGDGGNDMPRETEGPDGSLRLSEKPLVTALPSGHEARA